MRTSNYTVTIALVFALLFGIMHGQAWIEQDANTSKPLLDVHFASGQTGWIASITNSIFYTNDEGENWVDLSPPPSVNYYTTFFVNSQKGYAGGHYGHLRYTSDAGTTWTELSPGVSYNFWEIFFLDENRGWIAGGRESGFNQDPIRYIIQTMDGGVNWNTQLYDVDEPQLFAIHFCDANNGYAVGDAGSIFHTTDGGATWTEQSSGTLAHLRGVYATSPDTAWVVGQEMLLLRTTNGGTTWDSVHTGSPYSFSKIQFVDGETGYIAGGNISNGMILHTSDGGQTWNPQNTGNAKFLYSLYFTDPDTGYAVGYDGTIIHTTTGGMGIAEYEKDDVTTERIFIRSAPNPFIKQTKLMYNLIEPSSVQLSVYNTLGELIAVIHDGYQTAGRHSITWQAQDKAGAALSNGVYYVILEAMQEGHILTSTEKLIVQR